MGLYTELENSPIGKKLTAAGFAIMNTGGGCMAWGRETKDESLILIGQGDGDLGENGSEEGWGTCVTRADGEYLEWLTKSGTLEFCIAEMSKIEAGEDRMPANGQRVAFSSDWEMFAENLIIKAGEAGTLMIDKDAGPVVVMDRLFPELDEWENAVFLSPRDAASLNSVTETGWVLLHLTLLPPQTEEELRATIDAELTALTEIYTKWLAEQGLDLGSADEHVFDEDLTEEQRAWLKKFSDRWEGASPVYSGSHGLQRHREAF